MQQFSEWYLSNMERKYEIKFNVEMFMERITKVTGCSAPGDRKTESVGVKNSFFFFFS